jgi:hypothetical protein
MKGGKFLAESIPMLAWKRLAAPIAIGQHIVEGLAFSVCVMGPRLKTIFPAWLAAGNCQISHECSP